MDFLQSVMISSMRWNAIIASLLADDEIESKKGCRSARISANLLLKFYYSQMGCNIS